VLSHGTLDIRDKDGAGQSPLAERLFAVPGVSGVFFGSDFISVTKASGEWQQLKPAILGAIMEHFMSGVPLLSGEAGAGPAAGADEFFDAKDAETVATIKELLETRVRPAVENDGGDIIFRGFKDVVVFLDMKGACAGCPSSTATLSPRYPELAAPLRARCRRGAADVAAARSTIGGHAARNGFIAVSHFERTHWSCASSRSTQHSMPAQLPCSIAIGKPLWRARR
jgi:Fe-S cluster biogenesis protein NfuA